MKKYKFYLVVAILGIGIFFTAWCYLNSGKELSAEKAEKMIFKGELVYAGKDKYHKENCRYAENGTPMKRDEAEYKGCLPCKRCIEG